MKRIGACALVLMCAACAGQLGSAAPTPVLDRTGAERLALRADDHLRAAESGAGISSLASVFRDPALTEVRTQAQRLAQRGLRIVEKDASRSLVFFDAVALQAVLAVTAEHRLISPDNPDPAWAETARQWWIRFAFGDGAWWVIEQQDLPPDSWRS